jgi:formylmethanofuran dehydrogenase subunit D
MLFIAYGPESSRLLDGETHGTSMPDSKGIEVEMVVPDGDADQPPVDRA